MARTNNQSQLATKRDIKGLRVDFSKEITKLDIRIDKEFGALRKDMVRWRDDILTVLDNQSKILDRILTEQQAITANYKQLDQKVEDFGNFKKWAEQLLTNIR
jgi:hypothetical protein